MKPYLDTFGMIAHIFQPGRVGHTAKRFAASIGEGVVSSAQLMQPWAWKSSPWWLEQKHILWVKLQSLGSGLQSYLKKTPMW